MLSMSMQNVANPSKDSNIISNLKYDLPASVIVFLVAVPLCLGIALASGAPLFSGIIAGIVGGIVVGILSGSQLGVSGPAAGLAVIVATAIIELGSFEIFLAAVVLAGVFQVVLGLLRAGIVGYYFPSSVISGMLSGIGIVIILKQIPHGFGYDKDFEGSLAFTQPDGHNTVSELFFMMKAISPAAAIITLVSVLLLVLWDRPFIKKIKAFQIIQGPLVVVALGIVTHLILQGTTYAFRADQLVSLPVTTGFTGFLHQFTLPDFNAFLLPAVWITGMTLAIVASLETLLCLEATDKIDPFKRVAPANRELFAQGVGNIVSGFIGGLPVTQVIVRSSTNIQSGGRTKVSAIVHGIILLMSAIAIPTLLNMIPLASLAAILLVVGYKLAKPALFKKMYALGPSYFVPFLVTICGIVFTDLLMGIGLGLTVAIFYLLHKNFKKPFVFSQETLRKQGIIRLELAEDVTFLNKASIRRTLDSLPNSSHVVIDASRTINIDQDVVEIIEDFAIHAKYSDIKLEIIELHSVGQPNPVKTLKRALRETKNPSDTTTDQKSPIAGTAIFL